MIDSSLVSVICLCYNHRDYVGTAIQSVLAQDYPNVELIVVDDASKDGSQEEIQKNIAGTDIHFISQNDNSGHCKAFNKGLEVSSGQYIIDLAADDMLLPERISEGIKDFKSSEKAGVHYSDAYLCDEGGRRIGTHYDRDENGQILSTLPRGNIYSDLISRYFICPPTMMMKREVLEELDGYDESLEYEDFDFWIRSSRKFDYISSTKMLTVRRILSGSDSKQQFALRSKHAFSTYRVCEKIYSLNESKEEDLALQYRIQYEIKLCLRTLHLELIPKYLTLARNVKRRLSSY